MTIGIMLLSGCSAPGDGGKISVTEADSLVDAYAHNPLMDHVMAYHNLERAIDLYDGQYPEKEAKAHVLKAMLLFQMNMYDESLEEINLAAPSISSTSDKIQCYFYSHRASLLTEVKKDYPEAIKSMNRSVDIAKQSGDWLATCVELGNLAQIYTESHDFASAKRTLGNIDSISHAHGVIPYYKSQYYYVKALSEYMDGDTDSAYIHFADCYNWATKFKAQSLRIETMKYLSRIDSARADYQSFFSHYRLFVGMNDKMKGSITVSKINAMKEQNSLLKLHQERQRHSMMLWAVSAIALFVIISATIIIYLIIRRNREKDKINELTQEKMVNHLQLEKMEKELLQMRLSSDENKLKKAKQQNLSMSLQLANREWNEKKSSNLGPFAKILGQLDPNFIPNIEKQYPDISKTELRLACFIKLKMSAEEISRVMNISTSSFYTLRYRLRKRLGLKGNESLESIIDSF